ncbi:MAG: hypothetical protein ACWA5P_11105 [bacterium]
MKNKSLITFIVVIAMVYACSKPNNPFLINPHSVGLLTDSTQVKDLANIYINDSIVNYVGGDEFTGAIDDIDIYAITGEHLLTLSPEEALDSTSVIKTITIKDERFITTKGINMNSTFGDIQSNYKISNIQNTLKNVLVSVNEINAFFTIDKDQLPANLRYDMSLKIEAVQIPESAKIKSFNLYW